MNPLIAPLLYVVLATNIIFAAVILSQGFGAGVNILFGLIALSTAVWSFAIAGFYSGFLFSGYDWTVLSHLSAAFLAYVFFCFSANFSRQKKSVVLPLFASLPFLAVLRLLINTDLIVGDISGITYRINEAYPLYSAIITAYFFAGYTYLFNTYKFKTNQIEKKQVGYVLVGSVLPSAAATVTDLIFPYFGLYQYTWLGPVFTLILVGTIFIAIIRYHLFNIKVIATELLTFGLWIFILARTLFSTTYEDRIANGGLLVAAVFFGVFLIRSVLREVRARERIQGLADELLQANARLQQLDRQKSEFLSIASHQLRTPLTAMKGYSSMILEGSFGAVPEQMRDAVDKIFQSSQRLAKIIDEFLNVTRIELGTIRYDFAEVDFRELVQAVLDENEPSIKASGLEFSFVTEGSGSATISADTGKLRQVLSNLVENAIRYTPKGSVHMILTLGLPGNKLRLSVADTGIGVPKETMVHLFEKFSRAQNAAHVNTSGSGLGLYVAREIIKAHKGRIWAESEGEGKGAVFLVELETLNETH